MTSPDGKIIIRNALTREATVLVMLKQNLLIIKQESHISFSMCWLFEKRLFIFDPPPPSTSREKDSLHPESEAKTPHTGLLWTAVQQLRSTGNNMIQIFKHLLFEFRV